MSSGEKKHDYHLVDPSPWPIFTSFACLVLAVGAVYYFHTKALWLIINWNSIVNLWIFHVVQRRC